jgi:sulfite exporter TauE/SafE
MITSTLLLTVFVGALVSGWHCALMCGGIAAAVERSGAGNIQTLQKVSKLNLAYQQLVMHAGRISTYMFLGGFAGLLGVPVWQQNWLPIQRGLFVLAALIFIFQAYRILLKNKAKTSAWEAWLNSKTSVLWSKVSKSVVHSDGSRGYWGRFLSGLIWGLVPCGLIYGVLPLAFLSGDPVSGALFMLAFGLGTLPNLLLISGFSARIAAWGHQAWARYLAAALMLGTGLMGLYRALTLPDALLKGGFCIASSLNYNVYLVG